MTIILKNKLNLKTYVVRKINLYIYNYKNQYDIESIYFNQPIDGIQYFKYSPFNVYTERYMRDWYEVNGSTLVKILNCLKSRDFYGYCRTRDGNLVKIIPKKPSKK